MTISQEAGALRERVAFQARAEVNPDAPHDYGNTVSGWETRFTDRAAFVHLRGGEAVMAGRLQGRHTQIVRVRASEVARQVSREWRLMDTRSGTAYAIRDITPDRMWIDFLCESGVAT